jgi:hypothetical protein
MASRDVTTPAPTTPDTTPGRTAGRGLGDGMRRLATETKHAIKTTEFYAFVVVLIGILIAGNAIEIKEGGTDYFTADKVWLYITILTVGYMISRGLAKSGGRDPYWADSGQNHTRDGNHDR